MEPEVLISSDNVELVLLSSEPGLTVTRGRFAPGARPAGRHIHHKHIDMFYVLEGALTLEVGPDAQRVIVEAGGSISVPAGVAHCFMNDSDAEAVCLNVHAPDGGFADFMRGMRDGVTVEWDAEFIS